MKKILNKNVDIFIYGVKAFTPLVSSPVYKILVNSHDKEEDFHTTLPIYRDYEGLNISDNNLVYNEYTGLFWIWNNWELKDYIGVNHYRRYYDFLDNVPNINELFKGHKIILNNKFQLQIEGKPANNRDFYAEWHNVKDFDLMGEIVKELYPEYADGWDKMAESTHIYPSSIFIMPKRLFNDYMQYIFDVTEEFNDRMGCQTNDDYIKYVEAHKDEYVREKHKYYDVKMQARMVGYLIERCLCAFLMSGGSKSLEANSVQLPWHVYDVKYNV